MRNPGNSLNRTLMSERFGIAAPAKHEPLRPIGRTTGASGKLLKERVSSALGAPPPSIRHDPAAIAPIGPKDVAAGLYSLVTRGLIPPNVDLTPALERKPCPLVQAPARVHDFKAQFAAHHSAALPYVSARSDCGWWRRRVRRARWMCSLLLVPRPACACRRR